jgi:uncharacterized protein
MDYIQANLGRVFVVRIDDGEDLLQQLNLIIKKEKIKAGYVHLIGASKNSKAVLGPYERSYPPNPYWWEFDDARELLGLGIFAWENDEPKIHIHSGIGHFDVSKIGCIREKSEVYLTIEAVIQEIIAPVSRKLDNRYNASLLDFEK